MGIVLETDRQRDQRVLDECFKEYEKYGELAHLVYEIEQEVLDLAYTDYMMSRSGMATRLSRWATYIQRYRGQYQDAEESPFSEINPPRMARIIDVHVARTLQVMIPDRSRMDFFQFIPEDDYSGQPPDPQTIAYCEAAANAVRNDLICGKFVRELKRGLYDLFMLGNMVLLPIWEQEIQYRYKKIPNPEYDPTLAPEANVRVNYVKGQVVFTAIPPEVTAREAYRDFDAPKMRYINPRNVFPSELDRNSITDCSSVSIYDTVRLSDLLEDEIASGGHLYANLGQIRFSDERSDVPEIADRYSGSLEWDVKASLQVDSARKINRVTRMGSFRLEDIFGRKGVEDGATKKKLIKIFADKFDWDVTKIRGWDTWFIEHVNDSSVLVRWQPSPYAVDKKPIIHHGLFRVNNQTWADGICDRVEPEEIVANAFDRYRLEATLKMVRPPVMIVPDMLDSKWRQMTGDSYQYNPNMLIRGKKGAKIQDVLQVMQYPTAPLQYADAASAQCALNMSEASHLPPVKMGSASGGATASEINNMGSSADIMLQEMALDCEENALNEALWWCLMLHHQLTEEPRLGYQVDENGKVIMNSVPPEVWTKMYRVNLLGFQQVGNIAIRAMNTKEAISILAGQNRATDAAYMDYFKLLGVRNPGSWIAPPPQPGPPLADKMNLSYALQPQVLPPALQGKVLEAAGIEVTPEDYGALGALDEANRRAAVYEATMERRKADAQYGEPGPGTNPDFTNGGAPGGVEESNPSNYGSSGTGQTSHHPIGEQDNRQRGLRDEQGMMRSAAQQNRNPANTRRAQG